MNANSHDIPKSRKFRFAQTPLALALRKVFSTSYLIKKKDSAPPIAGDSSLMRFESFEPRILMSADLNPTPQVLLTQDLGESQSSMSSVTQANDVVIPQINLQSSYSEIPGAAPAAIINSTLVTPIAPDGSLIYQQFITGEFAVDDSSDSITLSLDAGQKFSVGFLPIDPSLNGRIEIIDPDANKIDIDVMGAGLPEAMQNFEVSSAGTYTITFSSLNPPEDPGQYQAYKAGIWVNAQFETENYGDIANNDIAHAVNIDSSSVLLPNGADRLGVVGRTDSPINPLDPQSTSEPDYYSFTLTQGQVADIVLTFGSSSITGQQTLRLFDVDTEGHERLLALSEGGKHNVDAQIHDFVAPATGTYYARVNGVPDTDYSLVVTRGSAFELTASTPESIAYSGKVLGGLAGGDDIINVAGG